MQIKTKTSKSHAQLYFHYMHSKGNKLNYSISLVLHLGITKQ